MKRTAVYPFTAIVGQEDMKLSLILNVINPALGGVLIKGEKGTAKSTAVRALAELLPAMEVVQGCKFHCDPKDSNHLCDDCSVLLQKGEALPVESAKMRVVELPVSATEDRVVGTLDIEQFRNKIKTTLYETCQNTFQAKLAKKLGMMVVTQFDKFYFEKNFNHDTSN